MIKLNCKDTFNFICNNSYRPNIFKDKLNILLTHIDDYYNNYNINKINNEMFLSDSINNKRNNLNLNFINSKNNGNPIYNNRYSNNLNINNNKINLFRSSFNNNNLRNNNQYRGGIDRYNYNFNDY